MFSSLANNTLYEWPLAMFGKDFLPSLDSFHIVGKNSGIPMREEMEVSWIDSSAKCPHLMPSSWQLFSLISA
jgi:hypothetical protein